MFMNLKLLSILLFLSLQIIAYSQNIVIKAKNLESYCEKNLYKIVINIDISSEMKDYISFYLNTYSIKDILFKCMIDPIKKKIICISNLQKHKLPLKKDDTITLPYPFPEIEGISWDYNSFLLMIFRRTITINEDCGESVLKSNISKLNVNKWDLIIKINTISGGQCLLSDSKENYYSFNMNFNIIGGNLKNKLEESKNKKEELEIIFMQNITMPFVIGPLQSLVKNNILYKSHEYYKMAFCFSDEKINSNNYQKENGINFHCDIPISEQYIFNGPLKINTFSDNIYAKVSSDKGNDNIDYISLYFTTEKNPVLNTNSEIIDEQDNMEEDDDEDEDEFEENDKNSPNENEDREDEKIENNISPSQANLRRLEKSSTKKKKEYLLLDNRRNNFICPDKPIFEINNIKEGITYEPIPEKEDKYNIMLTGYLKNGYKVSNKKIIPLEYTNNEIKFNLSITNNLVEEISEKKKFIPCSLSSGTFFSETEKAVIKCIGNKNDQKVLENTYITINWASKQNKYLSDILIKWPKDLTIHSKTLYSYNIKALSIKKEDHVCFEDKYYFYINILGLKCEPEISFEFKMRYPDIFAKCKLYNSNTLKCYLDLRLKKIRKDSKIQLPQPGDYNISTVEGNYIKFSILHFSGDNNTNLDDEGITADETCGNNMFIGAIQDIGYSYGAAIAIIISILVVFSLAFLGIGFCVIFEIKHRNKKGKYFAHTEEKKDEKNNNNSTTMSPISGSGLPNIIPK